MRLAIRILAFSFLLLLIVSSFMAFLERSAVQKEQPERQLPAKTNKVEAVDSAGKGRRIAEVGRKAEPAVKMSAEESEALSILAKGDLAKERELTELYSKVLGSVAEEAQKMANVLEGHANGDFIRATGKNSWSSDDRDTSARILKFATDHIAKHGNDFEKSVAASVAKTIKTGGKTWGKVAFVSSKQAWVLGKSLSETHVKINDFPG